MESVNQVDLSPNLISFLNENFRNREDLSRIPALMEKLKRDCVDSDRNLRSMQKKLSSIVDAWISRSNDIDCVLHQIDRGLEFFDLSPSLVSLSRELDQWQTFQSDILWSNSPYTKRPISCLDLQAVGHKHAKFRTSEMPPNLPDSSEKREMNSRKMQRMLREELPMLAKEMDRIETVRVYAETTLQLEALVGDLEDAVLSIVSQRSRNGLATYVSNASSPTDFQWKQEKLMLAIKAIKDAEEVLVNTAKSRPKWTHLLKAVDCRVDKTLAVLRLQALADHRLLLASLGWPPPLLTSDLDKEGSSEFPNPLLLMCGYSKERYSQSFLSLCALQHLQAQRESRQNGLFRHGQGHQLSDVAGFNKLSLDHSLWTIDELVSPIASRIEHHFSRWSDQPKFMFALVYKITRDFIGLDDVLQPLIDKARLVGYSAKEAWVSAMVKVLSRYLTKRIFSVLAERYNDWNGNSKIISSWLHLVDLIISFDKQMQALASSGTPLSAGESARFSGNTRGLSVLSIFCDRVEWLDMWAMMELKDAEEKVKSELQSGKAWMIDVKKESEFAHGTESESYLLSTREDYKAPLILDSVVRIAWAMIERSRMLPSIMLRVRFIRLSVSRFINCFLDLLLQRCQERESMVAHVDEAFFLRIACSINAAQYCEFILREWSEDIDFLEMTIAEAHEKGQIEDEPDRHTCFFKHEINTLMKLETEWVEEILASFLWQFDTLCWDYAGNRNQWEQEEDADFDAGISAEFVEALDALQDGFRILKMGLNSKDFLDLWRSVAGGIDHFIFSSILLSGAKFSGCGIKQFGADMRALFLIFQPLCTRPEAFFPFVSNSMKLLEMAAEGVKHLMGVMSKCEKEVECLHLCGVFHVSPAQAEKILISRKLGR